MLRHIVHLRGVDNVTASCPPSRMDGESTVEMFVENMIHSEPRKHLSSHGVIKVHWVCFPGVEPWTRGLSPSRALARARVRQNAATYARGTRCCAIRDVNCCGLILFLTVRGASLCHAAWTWPSRHFKHWLLSPASHA
jgi:hypothetical protein